MDDFPEDKETLETLELASPSLVDCKYAIRFAASEVQNSAKGCGSGIVVAIFAADPATVVAAHYRDLLRCGASAVVVESNCCLFAASGPVTLSGEWPAAQHGRQGRIPPSSCGAQGDGQIRFLIEIALHLSQRYRACSC